MITIRHIIITILIGLFAFPLYASNWGGGMTEATLNSIAAADIPWMYNAKAISSSTCYFVGADSTIVKSSSSGGTGKIFDVSGTLGTSATLRDIDLIAETTAGSLPLSQTVKTFVIVGYSGMVILATYNYAILSESMTATACSTGWTVNNMWGVHKPSSSSSIIWYCGTTGFVGRSSGSYLPRATFTDYSISATAETFYDIQGYSSSAALAVGSSGAIWYRTTSGSTQFNKGLGASSFLYSIDLFKADSDSTPKYGIIVGNEGTVLMCDNASPLSAGNWNIVTTFPDYGESDLFLYDCQFVTNNRVVITGKDSSDNSVFYVGIKHNGSWRWYDLPNNSGNEGGVRAMEFYDNDHGYAISGVNGGPNYGYVYTVPDDIDLVNVSQEEGYNTINVRAVDFGSSVGEIVTISITDSDGTKAGIITYNLSSIHFIDGSRTLEINFRGHADISRFSYDDIATVYVKNAFEKELTTTVDYRDYKYMSSTRVTNNGEFIVTVNGNYLDYVNLTTEVTLRGPRGYAASLDYVQPATDGTYVVIGIDDLDAFVDDNGITSSATCTINLTNQWGGSVTDSFTFRLAGPDITSINQTDVDEVTVYGVHLETIDQVSEVRLVGPLASATISQIQYTTAGTWVRLTIADLETFVADNNDFTTDQSCRVIVTNERGQSDRVTFDFQVEDAVGSIALDFAPNATDANDADLSWVLTLTSGAVNNYSIRIASTPEALADGGSYTELATATYPDDSYTLDNIRSSTSTYYSGTWYLGVFATNRAGETMITSNTAVKQESLAIHVSEDSNNFALISVPYDSGYTSASDIATYLNHAAGASGPVVWIYSWDVDGETTKEYYLTPFGTWDGSDFSIVQGEALLIQVNDDMDADLVGTYPDTTGVDVTYYPDNTNNFAYLSVPPNLTNNTAQTLITEINNHAGREVVKEIYHYTTGAGEGFGDGLVKDPFGGYSGTDFTIIPGEGLLINLDSGSLSNWIPSQN